MHRFVTVNEKSEMAMHVSTALEKISVVRYEGNGLPVMRTAALEIQRRIGGGRVTIVTGPVKKTERGVLNLALYDESYSGEVSPPERGEEFVYVRLNEDGAGVICVSKPYFLYWFATALFDYLRHHRLAPYQSGKVFRPAFRWQRSVYDFFLTQEGRLQADFNREAYVRRLAETGFTHIEVNGLAFPMGLETGPKGETYPMFYTYCPALDQFVHSELNEGIYPFYYLSANLAFLKENAGIARKYGLAPGLLCFEPRSVPEEFFRRYPMLRGARVDHPFRSFKPRYNMTITHPKVRAHYAEMLQKLLREVPELAFLSVWTNDSGAGFEFTKSLYVGRNGGAYLIREWNDDETIARCAGENALQFFYTLREAAGQLNPDFRVLTRMESFYGEHETIWHGLGEKLEVETASLVARGWEIPYRHPRYPDSDAINAGSVYQTAFARGEIRLMDELAQKNAAAHYYFAAGPHSMFNPLLGVPYPKLTFARLRLLFRNGVEHLAHSGGTAPPRQVPFNVNHEMCRLFQLDPKMRVDAALTKLARKWAGAALSARLLEAWRSAEEAILAFPNITPLYSTFGFSWYRLWVRPFVPNIASLPKEQRAYYENYMCTTPHNPNNVDLSRDVLFQLTTAEKCARDIERMDRNLWRPLDEAIAVLDGAKGRARDELGDKNVIYDQFIRLRALRCWFRTQHSVATWIVAVHGYRDASHEDEKYRYLKMLRAMIGAEMENTEELLCLWDSDVEFMATTDMGETPLMHGRNLADLWRERIRLMGAHIDDEPYIDDEFIEKMAGEIIC